MTHKRIKYLIARNTKGEIMEKESRKIAPREGNAISKLMRNPYFRSLNIHQQLILQRFVCDQVEEIVRQIEISGYEKGMVDTMACVVQVLISDYWQKTGKKRLPGFLKDVVSLMTSAAHEAVEWEEMDDYLAETLGVRMKTDWLGKDPRPTPKKLFKIGD